MLTLSKLTLLGAAGLLLAASPASAQTATITNSGSTNTVGYKIAVALAGDKYSVAATTDDGKIRNRDTGNRPATLVQVRKLFADLDAAKPLASLPVRHGPRSASFGTRTVITYGQQQSPDLTNGADPRTVALRSDIAALTKILHLGNLSRRPIVLHLNKPNTK